MISTLVKVKTQDLIDETLDWAVATADIMYVNVSRSGWVVFDSCAYREYTNIYDDRHLQRFNPSNNWAQGGLIIEREKIDLQHIRSSDLSVEWAATIDSGDSEYFGPTPLVAAMRCYVASRLGEEVEIPEELV